MSSPSERARDAASANGNSRPVMLTPSTPVPLLRIESLQPPFLGEHDDESTTGSHGMPSPLSHAGQPSSPRGMMEPKARRVRARTHSDDSQGSPLHHRRLSSSSTASVSGLFALAGDGVVVDDVCRSTSPREEPQDGLPTPIFFAYTHHAVTLDSAGELVFPDHTAEPHSVLGSAAASLNDSRTSAVDSRSATLSSSGSHTASSAQCVVSPITSREGSYYPRPSCTVRVASRLASDASAGSRLTTAHTTPTSTGSATPPQRRPYLCHFAGSSPDPMEDRPPLPSRLVGTSGSLSLSGHALTHGTALPLPSHRSMRPQRQSGAGEGSLTASDVLQTPPQFGSSGFFSGPAYLCLADTLDRSLDATAEGSHAAPLAPSTSDVPTPLHYAAHPSTRLSRMQPTVNAPAAPAAVVPRARRRTNRLGPLIELLSCGSSDEEDEEDEEAQMAKDAARAQCSAADQAVFATRYRQFLRDHVANKTNARGSRSHVGGGWPPRTNFATTPNTPVEPSRGSRTGFAAPASDERRHVPLSGAGGGGSAARHGLMHTGGGHAGYSGPWRQRSALPSPRRSTTTKTASAESDMPLAIASAPAPDGHLGLHLACFGHPSGARLSRSQSARNSTSCGSQGHRGLNSAALDGSEAASPVQYEASCGSPLSIHSRLSRHRRRVTRVRVNEKSGSDGTSHMQASPRSSSLTDLCSPFGLRVADKASSAWLPRVTSRSFIVAEPSWQDGELDSGSLAAPSVPVSSASLSRSCVLLSARSRSATHRARRVSDASKFTIGGDDGSSCADAW